MTRAVLVCVLFVVGSCHRGRVESDAPPQGPSPQTRRDQDALVTSSQHSDAVGAQSITTRLGFYHSPDDGDGNPFLDEELTVIEPVILYQRNVNEKLSLSAQLSYDLVSSASIDRLSKFPEQSGASGDYYIGLDLGANVKLSDFARYGIHGGFSVEYDYTSFNLGGSYSWDSEDKNSTYTTTLDTFFDSIDIIRFNGLQNEGSDERISVAAGFNWYQAFSPTTHGELGTTISFQSGFLETAYNAVVIEDPTLPPNPNLDNMARGREITEELPDSRVRAALHGRVRRFLRPGRAVELGGRVYGDSWGIVAFSLEPRLYQDLVPGKLRLQAGYRFYIQSAADDYRSSFLAEMRHRTQDSDLGDFMSHSIHGKLTWYRTKRQTWDLGLEYVLRDDGLDRILIGFGWSYHW